MVPMSVGIGGLGTVRWEQEAQGNLRQVSVNLFGSSCLNLTQGPLVLWRYWWPRQLNGKSLVGSGTQLARLEGGQQQSFPSACTIPLIIISKVILMHCVLLKVFLFFFSTLMIPAALFLSTMVHYITSYIVSCSGIYQNQEKESSQRLRQETD